jgi:hypothetical protein
MKIAILGWGSIVWDPRSLHIVADWDKSGPTLPIEFSRISDNGRLTLVIDEQNGVDVPTRVVESALPSLNLAISDLQSREGTPYRDRIGFVDLVHRRENIRARRLHPIAFERICTWVKTTKFDAAIWTAIGPRFQKKAGERFSVAAAIRYLLALPMPTRTLALEYIRNAPAEVVTPVRKGVYAVLGRI